MSESDRPTFNSLKFLTKVKPHHITRDSQLVDEWTRSILQDLIGHDPVEEFSEYTRSFYTLEGHYKNLWSFDRPIRSKPRNIRLDKAIFLTKEAFRLDTPVTSISWHSLRDVPFIPSSSAGYSYIGKKGDDGNLQS